MNNLQKIMNEINELRIVLHDLMEKSDDLSNEEILSASKALDKALNEYNQLIRKKTGMP